MIRVLLFVLAVLAAPAFGAVTVSEKDFCVTGSDDTTPCTLALGTDGVDWTAGDTVALVHVCRHQAGGNNRTISITADEAYTGAFAQRSHTSETGFEHRLYYRLLETGNDTSIDVHVATGDDPVGASLVFVDGSDRSLVNPTDQENASASTVTAPSITIVDGDEVIRFFCSNDNNDRTLDEGTQIFSRATAVSSDWAHGGSHVTGSGTSSGTATMTLDTLGPDLGLGATVAFSPDTETDAPVYTTAPFLDAKTADSATFKATATDASPPIDHYCSVYSDGASTPTAANVKAGTGTGNVSGPHSDLDVSSGSEATVTTGAVLTLGAAYDAYCMAEDNQGTPNQTAVQLVEFTAGVVPHQVTDTFTDTNSTAIASHTPNTDSAGNGWSKEGRLSTDTCGTVDIQSNQVSIAEDCLALIDTEHSDVYLRASWTPGVSDRAFLIGRRDADSDNVNCLFKEGTDTVEIERLDADSASELASSSFTFVASTTYELGMAMYGTRLVCLVDGSMVVTTTSSFNQSETTHGIGNIETTAQLFDDFDVVAAYSGVAGFSGAKGDDPEGILSLQSDVASGDLYWPDPADLPDRTYQRWLNTDGGSLIYEQEASYVGNDDFAFDFYDLSASTVTNITYRVTTASTAPPAAPVWGADPSAFAWAVDEPISYDLKQNMTTVGTPPSGLTCSVNSGTLPTGVGLGGDQNCIISGTPTTDDGISPLVFRASNATGNDDTGSIAFSVSTNEAVICSDNDPIKQAILEAIIDAVCD